jgi:ATP-dependent helicase/DNAse subunit B
MNNFFLFYDKIKIWIARRKKEKLEKLEKEIREFVPEEILNPITGQE